VESSFWHVDDDDGNEDVMDALSIGTQSRCTSLFGTGMGGAHAQDTFTETMGMGESSHLEVCCDRTVHGALCFGALVRSFTKAHGGSSWQETFVDKGNYAPDTHTGRILPWIAFAESHFHF